MRTNPSHQSFARCRGVRPNSCCVPTVATLARYLSLRYDSTRHCTTTQSTSTTIRKLNSDIGRHTPPTPPPAPLSLPTRPHPSFLAARAHRSILFGAAPQSTDHAAPAALHSPHHAPSYPAALPLVESRLWLDLPLTNQYILLPARWFLLAGSSSHS